MIINKKTKIEDIWTDDSYVLIESQRKNEIRICANRQGYRFLSKLFGTIAENGLDSAIDDDDTEQANATDCQRLERSNDEIFSQNESLELWQTCGFTVRGSADILFSVHHDEQEVYARSKAYVLNSLTNGAISYFEIKDCLEFYNMPIGDDRLQDLLAEMENDRLIVTMQSSSNEARNRRYALTAKGEEMLQRIKQNKA